MQLEKGHLPERRMSRHHGKYWWIDNIENGDSILVDNRPAANTVANTVRARNANRKTNPERPFIRPQTQTQANGSIRIWFWIKGEDNDS